MQERKQHEAAERRRVEQQRLEEQRRLQEEERRREREEEEALMLARKASLMSQQRDLASPADGSTPSPGSDSQGSSQPLTDESREIMRAKERERRRREAV